MSTETGSDSIVGELTLMSWVRKVVIPVQNKPTGMDSSSLETEDTSEDIDWRYNPEDSSLSLSVYSSYKKSSLLNAAKSDLLGNQTLTLGAKYVPIKTPSKARVLAFWRALKPSDSHSAEKDWDPTSLQDFLLRAYLMKLSHKTSRVFVQEKRPLDDEVKDPSVLNLELEVAELSGSFKGTQRYLGEDCRIFDARYNLALWELEWKITHSPNKETLEFSGHITPSGIEVSVSCNRWIEPVSVVLFFGHALPEKGEMKAEESGSGICIIN
jgi:hypothetical protein